jgi:ribosomal protein L35
MKIYKALVKRVKITASGKIIKRKAGQDHFNSRESGNTTRLKRTDMQVAKTLQKTIRTLLPFA